MQIGIGLGLALGAGRRAAFNPASIFSASDRGFIYDFTNAQSLYQDAAGTTSVTANGDPIGRALDLSPNGNHATQPNGGTQRPTFRGTYAEFDGSNDSLVTPSVDLSGTDTVTVVLGFRNDNGSATALFIENGVNGAENVAGGISNGIFGATHYQQARAGGVLATTVSTLVTSEDCVSRFTITTQGTTTQSQFSRKLNGAPSNGPTGIEGNMTGNFTNAPFNIGRRNNSLYPFTGRMYVAFVISRALTATEEKNLGKWIAAKLAVKLRVDCVGNSLTQGNALPSPATQAWPAVLTPLLPGYALVQNHGVSGKTTPQLWSQFETTWINSGGIDNYRPQCRILWEGINDMAPSVGNVSPATAYQHFLDYRANCIANGWDSPIYLVTCTRNTTGHVSDANVAALNVLIRANAVSDGFAGVIDLGDDPFLYPPLQDGLHLNATQTAYVATAYMDPAMDAMVAAWFNGYV